MELDDKPSEAVEVRSGKQAFVWNRRIGHRRPWRLDWESKPLYGIGG